jgi:RHS repeat-associated protein
VTSAAYKIGTTTDQTIAFTYDAGTYGKGRRTGASDANHSMGWVYDAVGRVTSKSQTVGTVAKTVGYGYTNGNLTSLTTPSGQVVVYGYNSNGQVTSITVNGTTLLSSVSYEPFGPIKGWTWGNGTAMSRTFDTDGKVTAIASGGSNKTYAFDDAFRITGITDTVTSANSYAYGFDSLDRLTSAVKTGTTRGWTYDANGNRLSETGASPSTYTISSSNNRVSSIAGAVSRTYTYDAAGNTLTYSNITATYNNRGRMKTLKKGSTTANFTYNALGELVKRTGGTPGTVHYVYDEAGHLLGEYNSTGALIQETVWLGDTPVATLRPGTPVGVFYVHTDHLNTPRKITRPSDNAARWTWESDPFGSALPNENPASLGTFKYNLRFPGQLYDAHTGLNYNYFRDYDPVVARYAQSDPIGLLGGINTYSYALNNPIGFYDPYGLWVPPSLPQGFVDSVTGFGDAFLIPKLVRDTFDFGTVDECSAAYKGGKITGVIWGAVPFAARTAAAVGATRFGHVLNHNRYLRIGPGRWGRDMVPRVSSPYLPGDGHYSLTTRLPLLPPAGVVSSSDCGCER